MQRNAGSELFRRPSCQPLARSLCPCDHRRRLRDGPGGGCLSYPQDRQPTLARVRAAAHRACGHELALSRAPSGSTSSPRFPRLARQDHAAVLKARAQGLPEGDLSTLEE